MPFIRSRVLICVDILKLILIIRQKLQNPTETHTQIPPEGRKGLGISFKDVPPSVFFNVDRMCNLHGNRKCPASPCDEGAQTAAAAAAAAAVRAWNGKERELIMIIGIRPGSFSARLKTT